MSDVILNFIGKDEDLKPAEDALTRIADKSGKVGEQWKKTSTAMREDTNQNVTASNKLAKSIDEIARASKSMDKAVIAGAYKNYLKQIQTQLGLTSKELIAYIKNARTAAQESIFTANDETEIKEITLSIEVMNDTLKELGATEDAVGEKTKTLRARIAEVKQAMVEMIDAGQMGTPEFEALRTKAGELDDQMKDLTATLKNVGSDTRNLDGLIGLASGVAGGFAIMQGAAALAGDENEEVQKALLKVNAAMSILQGLQVIANLLQKESSAYLLIGNLLRKETVATTVAQTAATQGATVAQEGLNVAMKSNPIGLIIIAITALVTALTIFGDEADDTKEKAEKLEAAVEALNDAFDKLGAIDDINISKPIEVMQRELDLAKERGASTTVILGKEKQILEAKLKNNKLAQLTAIYGGDQVKALANLNGVLDEERGKMENIVTLMTKIRDTGEETIQVFENGKVVTKTLEDLTKQLDQSNKTYNDTNEIIQENFTLTGQLAQAETKILREAMENQFKSSVAFAEADLANKRAVIIRNQVDSINSLKAVTKAEIAAIKERTAAATNKKLNPDITAGEIAKINAEATLQILELKKQEQQKLLDLQKSAINAQLILAKKGTQEEYDAKIKALENQRDIELAAIELTEEQRLEIQARFAKGREDAFRTLTQAQYQDQLSADNALLENYALTESEKLKLTEQRLDTQRLLELSQAEGNAAKELEIEAKFNRAKLDARKATIIAIRDLQLKTFDVFSQISAAANQKILASDKSTLEQKQAAAQQLLDREMTRLDLELAALNKQKADGVITQEQYNTDVQDINNRRAAATIESEERTTAAVLKEIDKRSARIKAVLNVLQIGLSLTLDTSAFSVALTEIGNFGFQVQDIMKKVQEGVLTSGEAFKVLATAAVGSLQSIINQSFADGKAERQAFLDEQLAALEDQKTKELEVKNLTEQQKRDIDDRYRQKEKQVKAQAFEQEKEARKAQAVINGLLAITLAFATTPFPGSLITAALVAVQTGAAVANIDKQKTPKFKDGKVDIDGPGTTTSDSIVARISKGESVINAASTAKHKDALKAINENRFDDFLTNMFRDFVMPKLPDWAMDLRPSGSSIDYDKLATAVADKMRGIIPAPAQIHNNIDKDGLHSFVITETSRIEEKNNRYKMISG